MKSLEISIDKKATKRNVIEALRKYNRLLGLRPVRSMPKVTQSFSFIPPSTAKDFNAIENAVAKNVEREKLLKEREQYMNLIHEAVEHLSDDGKYIIVNKYLSGQQLGDYTIYSDLGIGKTKYYQVQNDVLVELAMYLGMEVYKE